MRDWTRRHELGKILLDVAKYIATIVVVRGLFAPQKDMVSVVVGTMLAVSLMGVGYYVIPEEERIHGQFPHRGD